MKLKQWIQNELPNNGEWWKDGYVDFIHAAKRMKHYGMPEDEIKTHLRKLYNAVSNEFGA